jgi:hypothetical protein
MMSLLKLKIMKPIKLFPIFAMLLLGLVAGCEKSQDTKLISGFETKVVPEVNLGTAGNFAILSKTGITNVYKSVIVGNIGSSPITGAAIHVSCDEITGTIYSVDASAPAPCAVVDDILLSQAVSDMQTAYTDAAKRTEPMFLNLNAGQIGGQILTSALYKWTSGVTIVKDMTIAGGIDDVWIFQIDGTLTMSPGVNIYLTKGAQAKNVYWQVSGSVTIGTGSHFEGNILGQTNINLLSGASINGRILSQSSVSLQMNSVTKP